MHTMTQEDILAYVEEEDVRFIRLTFFDVFGNQKNVSILPGRLKRAFEKGITFDASSIAGLDAGEYTDLYLRPVPETMSMLPWRSAEGQVIQMICDLYKPDGTLYLNQRQLLKKTIRKAAMMGLDLEMAAKFEFSLFIKDEYGQPTKIPFDNGTYMDVAPDDKGENIRRSICLTLEEMGLGPQKSYHQEGPGQNEIDFHFADALQAADEASLFKWVVKNRAADHGLYASFAPKPHDHSMGNGFHVQIRFFEDDEELRQSFMAGILEHLPAMTLFFNPSADSYRRLGKDKAPSHANWSDKSRFAALRVPPISPRIMEVRSPDCLASPCLVFALIIEAGLTGIQENRKLPAQMDPDAKRLPRTLQEAKQAALKSEFIARTLPQEIIDTYVRG